VPVIAIIGAGPGLGAAVARRFGREGFSIALISRNQSNLDAMAAELKAGGLTARGYAADVLQRQNWDLSLLCSTARFRRVNT
jgi:short-subunit dehydrogenase